MCCGLKCDRLLFENHGSARPKASPSFTASLDWLDPTIIAPQVFIVAAGFACSEVACIGGLHSSRTPECKFCSMQRTSNTAGQVYTTLVLAQYLQGLDVAVSPSTTSRTDVLQARHTSLASLNCGRSCQSQHVYGR